jgi:hypothetical protein
VGWSAPPLTIRGVMPKVRCLYCFMEVHIYRGAAYSNPSLSRPHRCGPSDHHGGPLVGRARPHAIESLAIVNVEIGPRLLK